ncbi:SDR family NAD(P)-dependent oxidoreductase [uncultured Friedmanniella sp.]|uniref:SDR family NAD(P)-dependent oxidoreductase n=1 Tax=uncultured Friedmanniella sp. TaxID=335381 RepID=UPI0035CBEA9D
MTGRLAGRVAVVTGAAGGIGRAIATGLAAEGARVVVADVADGTGTVAVIEQAGGEAFCLSCDVAHDGQVQAMVATAVETYGGIDVLVNNAGISGGSSLAHELEVEVWARVLAVNLTGPFLCARAAMPYLLASGPHPDRSRGRVVNVASTYGVIGAPLAPAYCASKGGVVNLTRQLAVDYGPLGVRVNAICPGYIDTDMGGYRAGLGPAAAAVANARRESAAALQPLGRQAQADEVARVAVFLAGDDSSFMTGSIVTVDGGCTTTFNHG